MKTFSTTYGNFWRGKAAVNGNPFPYVPRGDYALLNGLHSILFTLMYIAYIKLTHSPTLIFGNISISSILLVSLLIFVSLSLFLPTVFGMFIGSILMNIYILFKNSDLFTKTILEPKFLIQIMLVIVLSYMLYLHVRLFNGRALSVANGRMNNWLPLVLINIAFSILAVLVFSIFPSIADMFGSRTLKMGTYITLVILSLPMGIPNLIKHTNIATKFY